MINTWKKIWPSAVFILFLLVIWESSVTYWHIDAWMLPAPSAIVKEFFEYAPRLGTEVMATIQIALAGLAIGVVVGMSTATFLHLSSFLKKMVYPLIVLSQNIPLIALAPLLVMWLGLGMLPKLIVVALVCFFPVTVSMMDGFLQTDRTLLIYLKMAGASRWELFRKLEWPSALPSLFSGLKVSATYSVMGAVIAEWLGAEHGLGVIMTLASSSFRTDRVMLAILLIMCLSLCLFGLITFLEWLSSRWKQGGGRSHASTRD
ncbi:ABC transporter permease [Hazenella coriacea]|uniref:ABC-type nitrate/sulfonate/bicarbonate transport system permease component n=1 Tax=Hazenella coriacea TaxID=1179467 RepID=A0A4R3L9V3_9BACL|nr:ABC transporter permease [Hazenella coriacea]TCS95905.1 ABC-type nitrate/sulfonate/bicarbonate transport system permease component [Hazenella coriacea]